MQNTHLVQPVSTPFIRDGIWHARSADSLVRVSRRARSNFTLTCLRASSPSAQKTESPSCDQALIKCPHAPRQDRSTGPLAEPKADVMYFPARGTAWAVLIHQPRSNGSVRFPQRSVQNILPRKAHGPTWVHTRALARWGRASHCVTLSKRVNAHRTALKLGHSATPPTAGSGTVLALFAESFAPIDHSTCALSVLRPYFTL